MARPGRLRLFASWRSVDPAELKGAAAVVVDVLRATTSIACAVASGAKVIPAGSVSLARRLARSESQSLLAGERGGVRIPGFPLDNSPRVLLDRSLRGRPVVLTTTNGTRAVEAARGARTVLAGALVNAPAVAAHLARLGRDVVFVCAGRASGAPALEDFLGAGAVIDSLLARRGARWKVTDGVEMALALFRSHRRRLPAALRETDGGRLLLELGAEADVALSARVGLVTSVPSLVRGRFVEAG